MATKRTFNEDLQKQEISRLVQMLNVDHSQLEFLQDDDIAVEDLVEFRERINKTLLTEQKPVWERLAGLVWLHKITPNFITNKIVRLIGPQFCANIVMYVPVADAVSISSGLDLDIMTDSAVFLDPENTHIQAIIEAFPLKLQKSLLGNLIERQMYFTLARYSDYLKEDLVIMFQEMIHDYKVLLHVCKYSTNRERQLKLLQLRFTDDEFKKIQAYIASSDEFKVSLDYLTKISLKDINTSSSS